MPRVIPPVDSHVDAFFWQGVRDDRLLVQRCAACSSLVHPPQPMCPTCRSLDRITEEAPRRGTVYSWLVSQHPSAPDDHRRLVALIELSIDDRPLRFVSNLRDVEPEAIATGMAVEVFFDDVDGVKLPQWRPVADEGGVG
jgi:uncharacterized OB-fold protein